MNIPEAIEKTEMLVLNKDGESIGVREIFIARDFMCFVNKIGNDEIEIYLVKPIIEGETED